MTTSILGLTRFKIAPHAFENLRDAGLLIGITPGRAKLSSRGMSFLRFQLHSLALATEVRHGTMRRICVTPLADSLTYAGKRRRAIIDLDSETIFIDRELPKPLLDRLLARAVKVEHRLHEWANTRSITGGAKLLPGFVVSRPEGVDTWCRRFVGKGGAFECPRCGRKYLTSQNFCRHLRDDHDVEPIAEALQLSPHPPTARRAEKLTPFYSNRLRTGPVARQAVFS